ncbi:hypothetical protein VTK73DRAFT_8195 [Phialemonium thermophilum]|uniref:Purine-cytosine permease n=1 Tax=Phialemonium thermophilum TaxID=223376 RepID=A0ABR3XQQ3_9PEZI
MAAELQREKTGDGAVPHSSGPDEGSETASTQAAPDKPETGLRGRLVWAAKVGRIEIRGIAPVPFEERTVKRTLNVFTLWWCMNFNILPITFGMIGPTYGLNFRDSSLVVLFFTLLTALLPAYLSTLGPKTGMRQMIQARYSFGRYIVCLPVLLNLATLTGFCVIMAVIGGQCLSAVSGGGLSPSVGIVVIAILALIISFCGFTVLHAYERWAWIPALIAIVVATGTGGAGLTRQATVEGSATASAVLSFGMIVASYTIPWACLASDFTTYLEPKTMSSKIFTYAYLGLCTPTILLMILGSAIGCSVTVNPSWLAGYDDSLVGGVLAAMLEPAGGFGKFLVVVLSFTLLGNIAATSYSITLNLQMLIPAVSSRVPRYAFALVLTAIVIPVSLRAASDFFANLENFVALIGYWSSAFLGAVLVEHFVFRGRDCDAYAPDIWEDAARLPLGIAALAASVLSFALVVPCMDQVWFTGPIARTTGDIGFEVAFVLTAVLYLPFRRFEKKITGR